MIKNVTLFFIFFLFFADNPANAQSRVSPPGTIYLKDNLYIDQSPISNISYREFLYLVKNFWSAQTHDAISQLPHFGIALKGEDMEHVIIIDKAGKIIIDTNNAKPDEALFDKMKLRDDFVVDRATNLTMLHYGQAQVYNDYPIVYINYEQAETFCRWRSDWVMLHYALISKNKSERKRYYSKVNYRLMTEEEWKYAYEKKSEILYSSFGTRGNSKLQSFVDYNSKIDNRKIEDKINIYGNIFSELLIEKNAVIGLSWINAGDYNVNINKDNFAPSNTIGFRCICEVQE